MSTRMPRIRPEAMLSQLFGLSATGTRVVKWLMIGDSPEQLAFLSTSRYTLLLVSSAHAINATLYDNLSFNFMRDIAPVASITRQPQVMLANPSLPARTVAKFIAYAKANPERSTWLRAATERPPPCPVNCSR